MQFILYTIVVLFILLVSCNQTMDNSEKLEDLSSSLDLNFPHCFYDALLFCYSVSGNTLTPISSISESKGILRNDTAKHRLMWERLTNLIPLELRENNLEIIAFDGTVESTILGAVISKSSTEWNKWTMFLSIEGAFSINGVFTDDILDYSGSFTHTVIHEFAHIFTLQTGQIESLTRESCDMSRFYLIPEEACANTNSYINQNFQRFWRSFYSKHQEYAVLDNPTKFEGLFSENRSSFVTRYAFTNPVEDIAEVFTFFIRYQSLPSNFLNGGEKIALLYENPSLVDLRNKIRKNIGTKGLEKTLSIEKIRSSFTDHHRSCVRLK